MTQETIRVRSLLPTPASTAHPTNRPPSPKDKRLAPARPVSQQEKGRPRSAQGDAREPPAPPSLAVQLPVGQLRALRLSIPPTLPPPPRPPTLGVRMCSMAGPRLQGPRRARPHAPARACSAMGREGRGLRPERAWAGRGPGSASRCAGCAGAPGRLRGPGSSALRLLAPAGLTPPLDFAPLLGFASLAEDLTAQAALFFFFSPEMGILKSVVEALA